MIRTQVHFSVSSYFFLTEHTLLHYYTYMCLLLLALKHQRFVKDEIYPKLLQPLFFIQVWFRSGSVVAGLGPSRVGKDCQMWTVSLYSTSTTAFLQPATYFRCCVKCVSKSSCPLDYPVFSPGTIESFRMAEVESSHHFPVAHSKFHPNATFPLTKSGIT